MSRAACVTGTASEGLSIVQACASLPQQRHAIEAEGKVLRLPRTGAVVVPYRQEIGWWAAVVVRGAGESYVIGGHDVAVFDCEIETAEEVVL